MAAFSKSPTLHLSQNKPVEFVWNGEQTLYLVGLPDNKRIVTATVPQKHNSTMPGLLFPISSGTLHHQPNHQQIQQHIILTPAPAPPPPPPLDLISNIKVEMKPVISTLNSNPQPQLVADRPIKIEFTPPPPPLYETTPVKPISTVKPTQSLTKAKTANESQVMTDVLEILIKNGELPETAVFDPTTPTTISLSNNTSQQSLHQTQNPMLFSTLVNPSQLDTKPIPNQTDDTNKYLQDPHRSDMDNIEMLSPMQPDCDNSVSSFDIFVDRHEQIQNDDQLQVQQNQQQQPQPQTQSKDKSDAQQDNQNQCLDDLIHGTNLQQSNHPASSPFDDLELMELMGHHLDMDMNDDPCHQFTLNNHMRLLNNDNNICGDGGGGSKINRRDPSLQPSLNELIQQQQQSQQHSFSNAFGMCHNNNVNHMSNGSNHNNHMSNNLNNNNNNNNNHNSLDHLTYTSTPMDIEDFDTSMSSFDFPHITGVSNDHQQQINTPPHPFGQSNLVQQSNQQNNQQSMSIPGQQPSGSHLHNQHYQQQSNHQQQPHLMQNNYLESMGSHDAYDTSLALNSENILDLFNIDDFKMGNDNSLPWSEVDFAA